MGVVTVVTRPLTAADIPQVLAIENEVFPAPWTEWMFRDELAAAGRRWLAIERRGTIIAYGGIMVVDGDGHVMNLAVAPGHRRRGLATGMLLALVDEALGLGASHLTLELRVSNTPARSLYERFGFTAVGVRPGYYDDPNGRVDALIMWLHDLPAAGQRIATLLGPPVAMRGAQ